MKNAIQMHTGKNLKLTNILSIMVIGQADIKLRLRIKWSC